LHGVGTSVVNALSEALEVEVRRNGTCWHQSYSRGAPLRELTSEPLPREATRRTGTRVAFRFDSSIFTPGVAFEPDTLRARLRELAFLNSTSRLRLRVLRDGLPQTPGAHAFQLPEQPNVSGADGMVTGDVDEQPDTSIRGQHFPPGVASASSDGWQEFHFEGGLSEYVTW